MVSQDQGRPWWELLLDNGLALSILFIFIAAIISLVVNQRRRDKCLKLMDNYHATYMSQAGSTIWGDLTVFSRGLEVIYDASYQTRRGIFKTSSLIHEAQLEQMLAICRLVHGLTTREKKDRTKQISRSFNPNPVRRFFRSLRNLMNTLKDAFSSALTLLIGQLMKTKAKNTALGGETKRVNEISTTLLGAAGNAYEPMLERRIGKPVVLQVDCKTGDTKKTIDLPGYLVDYNAKYIAVFNVDQEPVTTKTLTVREAVEADGYTIGWQTGKHPRLKITCTGPDVLVVRSVKTAERFMDLEIALVLGTSAEFPTDGGQSVELTLELTRRIDIVAPRALATIYHGGELHEAEERTHGEQGVAPEEAVEDNAEAEPL